MIDNKSYKLMLDMELNETKSIDTLTHIIRVPGGWIYRSHFEVGLANERGCSVHSVFVPEPILNIERNYSCLNCINSYETTTPELKLELDGETLTACKFTHEIVMINEDCKNCDKFKLKR